MGKELEIKLALATEQDFVAACSLGRDAGKVVQDNRFFDLSEGTLRQMSWALRMRRQWRERNSPSGPPQEVFLTVKGPSKFRAGAVERAEYEWPLRPDVFADLLAGRITPLHTAALAGCSPFWTAGSKLQQALSTPLTDMIQVAWFQNLRVRRKLDLVGRALLLEIDATTFPSGRRGYEIEVEIETEAKTSSYQIETLRRRLVERLAREGIVVTGSGRGKFSTALEETSNMKKWKVPNGGCLLRFDVLSKARVWGGQVLADRYAKPPAPDGRPCGETWEIVDLPDDQSKVVEGPLAGATLGELRNEHFDWLMGRSSLLDGRFPLLLKLIDARRTLSVQVHPDAEVAARLGGRPKTECWVILDADPGACLYLGLRPGVTREHLRAACQGDSLEPLLNKVEVRALDVIFIPAGTVHAIGAGLVLAELQQASDTTYRLHDWGRMGLDGKPRQLHIEQAIESIHFDMPNPPPWKPRRGPGQVISCEAFSLDLYHWENPSGSPRIIQHAEPLVILTLTGAARVRSGRDDKLLETGRSALAPAAGGHTTLSAESRDTWVLVGRPA